MSSAMQRPSRSPAAVAQLERGVGVLDALVHPEPAQEDRAREPRPAARSLARAGRERRARRRSSRRRRGGWPVAVQYGSSAAASRSARSPSPTAIQWSSAARRLPSSRSSLIEGRAAAGHAHLRPQAFREREVVLGVPAADGVRVRRPRELGRGELAHDLELRHALVADLDQALRDQRVEHARRGAPVTACAASSSAPPTKTASARNTCCSSGSSSATLHSSVARIVRWRVGASRGAALEQRQRVREPRHELLGLEQPDPSRRELDRERKPVEPAAQLRDRRRVAVGEPEVRPPVARAVDEQRDRVRHGERRDRQALLAAQPQRLAARGQHVQPRARRHELAEQRARRRARARRCRPPAGSSGPPRRRTSASSSRSPGCTATFTARTRAPGTSAAAATRAR